MNRRRLKAEYVICVNCNVRILLLQPNPCAQPPCPQCGYAKPYGDCED